MTRRRVKGPNGLEFDLPEVTATGLVGRGNRGYEYVDGDESADTAVALDKRTVKQLKAYADENGIDLGGATKKPEILAAIAAGSDNDGDSDESTEEQE